MRWPVPETLAAESTLQLRVNGAPQVQDLAPTH
ncbi:hypothetical protein PBOI14_51380 [Pseudomonas sp. Boi14]|nr:hypothetical protein PBOI14_51380 [Pseudomonas sp. Boi14]